MKKQLTVLGIDPGLANTGYALIHSTKKTPYDVAFSGVIQTKSNLPTGQRLYDIDYRRHQVIAEPKIDIVIIEHVFFNRNVKSAIGTAKVIGLFEHWAYKMKAECILATPQQIKKVSGLGAKADKHQMMRMIEKITGVPITSEHEADAIAAAMFGVLNHEG